MKFPTECVWGRCGVQGETEADFQGTWSTAHGGADQWALWTGRLRPSISCGFPPVLITQPVEAPTGLVCQATTLQEEPPSTKEKMLQLLPRNLAWVRRKMKVGEGCEAGAGFKRLGILLRSDLLQWKALR